MTPSQAGAQRLESRRRRARQACAPYRSRKRRCDGHFPCKTCVEFEDQCFFTRTPRKHEYGRTELAALSTDAPEDLAVMQYCNECSSFDAKTVELDRNPFKQRTILDPLKIRYASASSAVAFPRIVGLELSRDRVPRLHSFGWHQGIRTEPRPESEDVRELISFNKLRSSRRGTGWPSTRRSLSSTEISSSPSI